jgi:hypothetical protein
LRLSYLCALKYRQHLACFYGVTGPYWQRDNSSSDKRPNLRKVIRIVVDRAHDLDIARKPDVSSGHGINRVLVMRPRRNPQLLLARWRTDNRCRLSTGSGRDGSAKNDS